MRMIDAWRLGVANINAQKKRSLKVVIIVGLLFSVIIAAILLLQGGQNAVYGELNRTTKGRPLMRTEIDEYVCEREKCDRVAWQDEMKATIEKYGGEVLVSDVYQGVGMEFYVLPASVFTAGEAPMDVVPVVLPVSIAAMWAEVELPEIGYTVADKAAVAENVQLVQEIYAKAKGKTVTFPESDTKYYILDLAPANMSRYMGVADAIGLNDLLSVVLQTSSPMPLSLIARDESTDMDELTPEATDEVWAVFPTMETAYEYSQDPLNACSVFQQDSNQCPSAHRYKVKDVFDERFGVMVVDDVKYYQTMWQVLDVAAIILIVVALIVMLSTYTRIMAQDTKIISLYHAMGATKSDIRKVYCAYLFLVSLLASGFALMFGVLIALTINLLNSTALTQTFVLNFGSVAQTIWLLGWNGRIWLVLLMPLLVAPLTVWLNNRALRFSGLARKLK